MAVRYESVSYKLYSALMSKEHTNYDFIIFNIKFMLWRLWVINAPIMIS